MKTTREASRLARLPSDEARRSLLARISRTFKLEGIAFETALDYNAQLVTELRERGVRIWGVE